MCCSHFFASCVEQWAESFTKDFLFPGSRKAEAKDEKSDMS